MSTQSEEVVPSPDVVNDVAPDVVVPDVAVDNVANAKAFGDEWAKLKGDIPQVTVSVPGTDRFIEMSHVEVSSNVISVWTSTDHTLSPDFVLVNAPTSVPNANGIMVEDPMAAVAIAIDGATN